MQTTRKLQFAIRHLLLATIGVSLVAALVAPWLRSWTSAQWLAWGCHFGIALAVFGVWSLVLILCERWGERWGQKHAGTIHWQLPIQRCAVVLGLRMPLAQRWIVVVWSLVTAAYLFAEALVFATVSSGNPEWPLLVELGIFVGLFLASTLFANPAKRLVHPIGVADCGIVWGGWIYPWSVVAFHDATAGSRPSLGLKLRAVELAVDPLADAAALIEFLGQRAKRCDAPLPAG